MPAWQLEQGKMPSLKGGRGTGKSSSFPLPSRDQQNTERMTKKLSRAARRIGLFCKTDVILNSISTQAPKSNDYSLFPQLSLSVRLWYICPLWNIPRNIRK